MNTNNRRVKAIRDIFDINTGNLIVPIGAEGQVLFGFVVPNDGLPGLIPEDKNLILRVDFSGKICNIKYGVDADFINGIVAVLDVLYTGVHITEVKQVSAVDISLPPLFPQSIQFFFSSGLHLRIFDDRVTGSLRFKFFVDRVVDILGVIPTYKKFQVLATDSSVTFNVDHYEWTLDNTAMTSDELIFQRGVLLLEGMHYTLQRNSVGTKVIFSPSVDLDVTPPDIDYLIAVYKQ